MGRDAINEPGELEKVLNDPYAEPGKITFPLIQKITDNFTTKLGSGGYGDVYLGRVGVNKKVAVKKVKYASLTNVEELFRSEVDCFTRAKHVNIVRLIGYCADIPREMTPDTNGKNDFAEIRMRYLCLEYAPCGDLQDHIDKSLGDKMTKLYQMILGICRGLEHIHKQEIIHLDLKPRNILLDANMRTKITDFGSSKCLSKGESTAIVQSFVGTEEFIAPEMDETIKVISYKSDVYALGATITSLLRGNNSKDKKLKEWLEENSAEENCPKEKKSFIDIARRCMHDDPNERITLQEIIVQLITMELDDLKIDDSEEVIKVVPHEMRFRPFVAENMVSSTLNLVNRTGQHVACMISRKNSGAEHAREIIGPRSTHTINLPREASERFLVQSMVLSKMIKLADFPVDRMKKRVDGGRIYEVEVTVVVEAPPQQGDTSSQVIQDSSRLLDVHPLELHVPLEPNKTIPCLLHLTNKTDSHVAFMLTEKRCWMLDASALYGIISPSSTHSLVLAARGSKMSPEAREGVLVLRSCLCDDNDSVEPLKSYSECEEHFNRIKASGGTVHKVKLRAVYMPKGDMTSEPILNSTKIISMMDDIGTLVSVDANPKKPWVAVTTQKGHQVRIFNYETQNFTDWKVQVGNITGFSPKFIAQMEWLMMCSQKDGRIDIYNYKSNMKEHFPAVEADSGTINTLAVHPTKLNVLSISGEREIKLWEWDMSWKPSDLYFMTEKRSDVDLKQAVFNPDDTKINSFAIALQDGTVKLWDIGSSECSHTLVGHKDQVKCMDFFRRKDEQQYLITGSNDKTAKVWDIQEMTLVHTLEGFMSPVLCVFAHPTLPILITGTKHGVVHVWSSLDYGLTRVFDIGCKGKVINLALACSVVSTRVMIGQRNAISIMDFGDESDMRKKGQKELETLEFRRLPSKTGIDIIHSLPVQKKISLMQVQESLVSQLSKRSEGPTPVPGTRSDGPTPVPGIHEIEQLLSKVDKLARKLPTTGQRLSRISRIFPPGHGPCVEAVLEATDYDVGVLESLKLATVYIRDCFVKLGKKQDAICSEFERKAVFMERQNNLQNDTAAVAAVQKANSGEASGAANYTEDTEDYGADDTEDYNDDDDGDETS